MGALVALLVLGGGFARGPGAGGGGGYSTVQDEGTPLTQRSTINFTGAGISCSDSGGVTVCTASGGGGGGNFVEVTVAFGAGNTTASTVVTGQSWVTTSSVIVCTPTLVAASGRLEGAEDAVIEGVTGGVHSRVAGTGFTLTVGKPGPGLLYGSFVFSCTGV